MYINNILFSFLLLFTPPIILVFITGNINFLIFAVILLFILIVWYCSNLYKSKLKGIPAKSRLFRGILEVHVGKMAIKKPERFIILFIDSILWAKENNIDKAVFFTWYSKHNTFQKYFNDKVDISYPSLFDRISNIYINSSYWFHRTGKKPMKVEIRVKDITELEIKEIQKQKDRLIKRLEKINKD